MKLTRLVLSGFKSFADSIDLPFEDGVTAIVGPNGCGKSNISDAVRWVLGEQRARVLRGARMDEVIFQGSAKRHPQSLAEVTLHFDNSDGVLPIAYHEVAITRRLSRNGQSDYLLNQSPVRLRDVQDLLRGTGLGGDAGVVIEGGAIERLLSDRPDERRSLFEEAAAIGLYRDRRVSTERRLEQTGEDLVRLDDRISEIQTLVRSLARQRGKAERHRKLLDERFAIVMAVARFDLAAVAERSAALDSERSALGEAVPQARTALGERERDRETCVQSRATAEAQRTEVERRLAAAQVESERLEGDLNLTAERQANAARRLERAREERNQLSATAVQSEREREAAADELRAAAVARESVQMELDLRAASEGEAREHLVTQRQRVRDLEDNLQRHAERQRALVVEGSTLSGDLDDLRSAVRDVETRRELTEREKRAAEGRLSGTRSVLTECERADQEAQAALDRARRVIGAAKERETTARHEHRKASEALVQITARRGALEDLEREHVGLAPGALSLLRERDRFGAGAVIGPLSDFLRAGTETAVLAERLLGDWLQAVLVRDESAANAIREWHETAQPGPLMLLPVYPGPASNGDPGADAAPVSAIEPAGAWSRALLAGQRPLDARADAIRRPNGAVFLPGRQAGAGPLQRRAELDRLHTELDHTSEQVTRLEREILTAAEALASAEAAVAQATAAVEQARAAVREGQAAADDAFRLLQRAEREWAETDEALNRARQRVDERSTRLREVERELAALDVERATMDSALAGQRAALGEFEAAQEAARERRVHWQVEEAQVSARAEAAQEREARAVASLNAARERITALDQEVREIEATGGDLARRRAEWTDALAERRVAVLELEAASTESNDAVEVAERALLEAEQSVERARDEVERLTGRSHRLDLDVADVSAQRRALVDRLETEWRRPVDELLATAPAVEGDPGQLREEAEQLAAAIEALGPVNPLAVDEHAEESRRLDDLQLQRADIVAARDSLQQALKEIEETARTMFLETFAAIRENFRTVFQTLFEGGECDVRLADEADPLNTDIEIHAAPRGKRTQRIHLLSSGERALVAVSLLFAIYLTKPSPFCLLDEVDAPLDDANVVRFVRLLREFKAETQFIVITHNPRTMQVADTVYGVTMQEPGVSTIVGVRLGELEPV